MDSYFDIGMSEYDQNVNNLVFSNDNEYLNNLSDSSCGEFDQLNFENFDPNEYFNETITVQGKIPCLSIGSYNKSNEKDRKVTGQSLSKMLNVSVEVNERTTRVSKNNTEVSSMTINHSKKRKFTELGDSKEDKTQKDENRRMKNRASARASRERRKKYVSNLETSNQDLQRTNGCLIGENRNLINENEILRKKIKELTSNNNDQMIDDEDISGKGRFYLSSMDPVKVDHEKTSSKMRFNPFSSVFWRKVLPSTKSSKGSGKKTVVMFMIVLSLAFFLSIPKTNKQLNRGNSTGDSGFNSNEGGSKQSQNDEEIFKRIKGIYEGFENQFNQLGDNDEEIGVDKIFEFLNVKTDNFSNNYLFIEIPKQYESKKRKRRSSNSTTFESLTKKLFYDVCSVIFESKL